MPLKFPGDTFRIGNSVILQCFPHISCTSCAWIPGSTRHFNQNQYIWTIIPLVFKMLNKGQNIFWSKMSSLKRVSAQDSWDSVYLIIERWITMFRWPSSNTKKNSFPFSWTRSSFLFPIILLFNDMLKLLEIKQEEDFL